MKKLVFALLLILLGRPISSAAQEGALLSLQAIHALDDSQASRHRHVDFEATVTYYRSYEGTLFVQDGDAAVYVQPNADYKLSPGDRVRISGTTHESFRPFIVPDEITVLRHESLPAPTTANFDDLIHARLDCMLVKVRATVLSADIGLSSGRHSTVLQLLTEGGHFDAVIDSDNPEAIKDLLDADVEVTGVVSGRFDGKMQMTGVEVHALTMDSVRVLNRPAASAWQLPIAPMGEILSVYHVNNLTPRVRVQGTVTFYIPGSAVVLQSGSKSLWINTQTRDNLKIGDLADATGFPDVHDGFLTLAWGEVQSRGVFSPASPVDVSWKDLTASHHVFDLVSIEAKVVTAVRETGQDEYVLTADGHLFSAINRWPPHDNLNPVAPPSMREIRAGSTVRVTGICTLEDSNPFNSEVPFDLLMRSPDDVVVVLEPPMLSQKNLTRAVSALLMIVLAVGGWGWTLRRKVRWQTEALERRIEREAAQERRNAQIEQRRSRILEDINGSRPLAEILEQITELVSYHLRGAPCWCEINDGARVGHYRGDATGLRIVREEIPARNGPPHGALFAILGLHVSNEPREEQAFFIGTRLATLAIETRRLYTDLVKRSEFDLLTGIYNRFSLDKNLDRLIGEAHNSAANFGLVYVDLNDFKLVNDVYGHHVGDMYLQEVASRMQRQLRNGDLLARLGGDEFAALVPAPHGRADVEEIAHRLESCFAEPMHFEGYELRGSASIGLALYPEDGTTKDSLLTAADAAMYVSKYTRRQSEDDARNEFRPGSGRRTRP